MSTIGEKLDRLREIQHSSTAPHDAHRLDAAIASALGTAIILVALVALLLAGVFVRKEAVRPGASAAHGASVSAVAAQAGFSPHLLKGISPQNPAYLGTSGTKGPMAGRPAIVLSYPQLPGGAEVWEYQDPNPRAPIAVDPQTQAPALQQPVAGVPCLVWLSPNRAQVIQVGFKTADGLVIFVRAPTGISFLAAENAVRDLASVPQTD